MKEFEQACKELNIPLFVLPVRSPKYNGNVERTNEQREEHFIRSIKIIKYNLHPH